MYLSSAKIQERQLHSRKRFFMAKIVVLGAGMVGSAIARDLNKKNEVTSADYNAATLENLQKRFGIKTQQADLSNAKEVKKVIEKADLVVGAVPGFMGFETCKAVIEAGKNMVDISFFPEEAMELDNLAKKKKVSAIVDCGVAPGMDNILLGYHYHRMKVTDFTCMVGGLPKERKLPFQYKAPFSPIDVIEEYTRPARLVENFETVTKPALSEPELIHFESIGTLEAFNTDGLRSLMQTMPVKNMREKTLRYPGHRLLMEQLRDAGMFSTRKILHQGQQVRPIDITAKVLLPQWKLQHNEKEFTVMRVVISGEEKKKPITYTYDLYDETDVKNELSSMARTTGFACGAAVNLLLEKKYKHKGISPPEFLGKDEKAFRFILQYLNKRNVIYKQTIS